MDFTGMSDYAIDALVGAHIFDSFIGIIMFLICIVFFISFLKVMINSDKPRKAKQYRQLKADMYVAAKVDKLAKQQGLSLNKEYIKFLNWSKKKRNQKLSLDEAIEADLKDIIVNEKIEEEKQ